VDKLKPYFVYSIIGGGVMLAALLVGEELHGPIFNDFLHKPYLWIFAFLETLFWVIPLTWIASVFIDKFPEIKGAYLAGLSIVYWVALSVGIFLMYQVVIVNTRLPLWSEANLGLPYLFGWYIPGVITIFLFSALSPFVFERKKNK